MDEGRVEQILVSPVAVRLPRALERVRAVAGHGLEGDRYATSTGTWSDYPDQTGVQLTLVEAEVLDEIGLTGAAARRNLVTCGVRLNDLVGRRFRVGPVICIGVRLCEPCRHLHELTGVAIDELAHRGGLRAEILAGGEIAVGHPVGAV